MYKYKVQQFTEDEADAIADTDEVCYYCSEPFKECDTLIPSIGVIVGETDVVRYIDKYWHCGCVADWHKSQTL